MKKVIILGKSRLGSGPHSRKQNLLTGFQQQFRGEIKACSITKFSEFRELLSGASKKTVITYTQDLLTLIFVAANFLLRFKHIHVVHGDFYNEQKSKTGIKQFLRKPINELICRSANYIVVSSNRLKDRLKSHIKKDINVIYNSYLFDENKNNNISKDEDVVQLITITGFTHYEKGRGIIDLISYLQTININKKIRLHIIGGGVHLEKIKNKIHNSNKRLSIKYHGQQTSDQINNMLDQSDIFVYCSYLDNGPVALLEAIQHDIPVLSNNIGYTSELLYNSNKEYCGIYDNVADFQNKITKNIIDIDHRVQMAQLQKQHAIKLFSNSTVLEKRRIICQ